MQRIESFNLATNALFVGIASHLTVYFYRLTVNGLARHIDWLLMTRPDSVAVNREAPGAADHDVNGIPDAAVEMGIGVLRTSAGQFLAELFGSWGKPDWFVAGTPFAQAGLIPDQIFVRDYITVLGNIARFADDPGYFIDYALVGVPYFRGGVDLGMQSAPNLSAALELISKFADFRPGYHRYRLINENERIGIELVANTDLGPGRPIMVGTPLLLFARMAKRCIGDPSLDAIVEVQHGPQAYADRFRAAIGCDVRYNASRDAISFAAELGARRSLTYDADLWRTAGFRCEAELQRQVSGRLVLNVRSNAVTFLAEHGRPPRLVELARQFGVSSRTMVRRLRSEGQTYQGLMEAVLKAKGVELLAQPDLAISEISDRLGFADPSSFYRSFRRWYQTTPTEFRARYSE